MIARRLARLVLAAALAVSGVAVGGSALAASAPTPAPSAAAAGPISVTLSSGIVKPNDIIRVAGSGWPARITIQASVCGNNALQGASDCSPSAGGQTVTDSNGVFGLDLPIAKPPKPCPCVVHVVSPDTSATNDAPVVVTGQPTAPLDTSRTIRTLTATSKLTGAGPLTAWLGGAAKRTFVLTMVNTGNSAITNPGVTLTIGKGADPTTLLATPQVGTILAGQTAQYRLPITIKAPAFGQYRVKAYFSDLDTPVSTTASTSSYPWVLIVLVWLLIQPLLLGLYRRRPQVDADPEDPFAPELPSLDQPPPVGMFAAAAAGSYAANGYGAAGAAGGAAGYGAAGAAGGAAGYGAAGAAGYAADPRMLAAVGATTAVAMRPPSMLVPGYQPVFGVTDLLLYLDPNDFAPKPTVAPRIVLGGIVPAIAPMQPWDDPQVNGAAAYDAASNGTPTYSEQPYDAAPADAPPVEAPAPYQPEPATVPVAPPPYVPPQG